MRSVKDFKQETQRGNLFTNGEIPINHTNKRQQLNNRLQTQVRCINMKRLWNFLFRRNEITIRGNTSLSVYFFL